MNEFLFAFNSSDYISNSPLTNFFNYPNPYYSSFVLGQLSDYYPKDGWELIKRDFGLLADGTSNPVKKPGPYFILYNKYSGKLRVIAAFPGLGAQQAVNVILTLIPSKKPSAILGFNHNTARSLDQNTSVTQVTTPASYPGSNYNFFVSDFQMAYDACTCQFESGLSIDFSTVNSSSVQMYGRLLGTVNPENMYKTSSSTFQLDQTQSFLTSVYDIPSNDTKQIRSGILTYKDINSLIDDYKSKSYSSSDISDLSVFGSILNLGIDITDIYGKTISKGVKVASKLSDFFSSKLKSGGDQTYIPPSVIHAEMSLTGNITDVRQLGSNSINIANPGSLNSNNKPEYNDGVAPRPVPPDVDYPIYNEVLGTFALLETPTLINYVSDVAACSDGYNIPIITISTNYYQLSSEIKYVFNPTVNVDLTKTAIEAALLVKVTEGSFAAGTYCGTNYPGESTINMEPVPYYRNSINTGKDIYISPFVPLSSLNNLVIGVSGSGYWVGNYYIRFLIHLVSNNLDKNGKPNQSLLTVTYEIPQTNVTPTNQDISLNKFLSANKDIVFSNSSLYTDAWNSITINSSVTAPYNSITLTSPTIVINPGGSIGPNLSLISKPIANDGSPVLPQTQSYVAGFCDQTNPAYKYKGNTFAVVKSSQYIEDQLQNDSGKTYFEPTAYPNPAQSKISFQYSLEQGGNVNLYITDLTGQPIATLVNEPQEQGAHAAVFDAGTLANGVYIYTLETTQGKQSKRLVIAK